MKVEITIYTEMCKRDKALQVDRLVLALARCGYAPYVTDDENVCFTADKDETVTELEETK